MKVILPHYRVEFNWTEVLAEAMGGVVENHFIKGDNETYRGTHYILPIERDITAMLEDTIYKEDVLVRYTSEDASFVGLYFYDFEGNDVDLVVDNQERSLLGRLNYNFSIVDSDLELDYIINKDTKIFSICIFIKKAALKTYFKNIPNLAPLVDKIFNQNKNTIIRLDRMSTNSALLIQKFKQITYDNLFYEFHFKALVYDLLTEYLKQTTTEKIVIGKALNEDFKNILKSKVYLLSVLEGDFPGVDFLAEKVSMSSSKYKKLFAKITGSSPGIFFQSNKLYKSKELLATGQYTIGEVAAKLNYSSISYMAKRFKETYGIYPKQYQNLL
ncbi:helix-turn-helix transcriptional regulator [Flavobacterium sp. NKUCC04_CG]|uniref:helix-turn-helix transcriptional regulator n=1 Tax=Flavobacterium sp. NKUCC04_CG TaxID=2842121 RepID=UPI001C5B5DD8|nr:helix-turn-helix transcriptional regulator [Flavobacterium sp. NKUCC04_CG]MBW3518671.1 helix-turn-helix transcriptional regulator [Flavobacterium sp. NKUCC04_CG]